MKPVIVVGAGLAGLTCARTLRRNRIPVLIFDAADRIGGRLKTDVVGNAYLDRGYQTYLTAYPHAKEQIDEDKLKFREFQAGVTIVWDGDSYPVSRENPIQFAMSGLLGLADKLKLGKWTADVLWFDQDDIDGTPDRSTEQYLREEGFSEECIDRFFRPFLGSIFLDRSLSTSCRQMLFVWKALNEGQTVVPAFGVEEIPKQIGATFGHDALRLNASVTDVLKADGAAYGIRLDGGESIESDRIVLACDVAQASALSGIAIDFQVHHVITLYFLTQEKPAPEGWNVFNGNVRGVANHVVVMPNSPPGAFVVATTILGERPETDDQLGEIVKAEMRLWFPGHDVEKWALLRCYRSTRAQPAEQPGSQSKRPWDASTTSGLFFAGEFTTNGSIDGAVQSGLECANAVLSTLGVGVA